MGYLGQVLLLSLATVVLSLRRSDFYRYGASHGQKALRSGDDQQANLNTRVPVILDNAQLTAIFVHTDGFLKFEPTPLGEQAYDFDTYISDYPTRLIAPFLTDIDTSSDNGFIWYGSTNDENDLTRARQDIYRYFKKDFSPTAVLIFTWEDVLQKGSLERATFQLVLATDSFSSYGIFMYEDAIGEPSGSSIYPQAGVTIGDGRSYFLLPGSGSSAAFDLYLKSNVGTSGMFIYDLRAFGDTPEPEGSGIEPEEEPFIPTEPPAEETSNKAGVVEDDCRQCDANGGCRSFTDGLCCVCADGYIGNGLSCLLSNKDIRVSGLMNGNINGRQLVDLDLHTFVVLGEGRTYVAVSPLDDDLGLPMQILSTIGEFMGWMFSLADDNALNGFQLTGGKLFRDAYLTTDGGYNVRITQDFLGFDDQGQLQVNTNVEGTLPVISRSDGRILYEPYEEIYERKEPGRIRSVSNGDIKFQDFTIRYRIDQTITFQECTADEVDKPAGQDSMSMTVVQQYTSFDSGDDQGGILRFATSSRIAPSEQTVTDPCAQNDCSAYATCIPRGTSYTCQCNEGYEGDGRDCTFIDICSNVDCGVDAYCSVFENGYECICYSPGNTWDGYNCRGACEYKRCPANAYCEEDVNGNAQCICVEDYRKEGDYCVAVDACEVFICLDPNARCQLDQDNLETCVCNHGYTLVGDTCELQPVRETCDTIVCETNAHCEVRNGINAVCYCNDGFVSNGLLCVEIPVGDPCVDNSCDPYAGLCRPYGQSYTCECLRGFDGDGYVCNDIDECFMGIDDCHVRAKCENYQGSFNCICLTGFEGDGRTCTASQSGSDEDGVLYFAQGNSLMKLPLNGDAGRKVYMNSRQTMIGVGYDCRDDVVYWTDIGMKSINSVNTDGTGSRTVIRTGLLSPEGVAIDWLSRNMYWTDSGYHRIEVANLNGGHRRVLFKDNMKYPRAIVVDPVGGNLYWTDWTRSNPKIETSALDGSGRKILVNQNIKLPNGLVIDHNNQQICWADAGTRKVECMNLNGDVNTRFTVTSAAIYPFSITVQSNIFYWTDWQSRRIENIDKNGDTPGTPLKSPPGGTGRLYGIVAAATCPAGTNACAYNNGDCSALCLPRPNNEKTCACGDTSDGNEIPCEDAP